jgi:hypothetical protein
MPVEVFHQIQYLCKNIPKVEWSGALFYTTEGSIEKPGTFKITLKTILPLDMGNSTYTEYHLDDRFIDFIEEDFEERCTWKLGHIHSHNVMGVFFSPTDMAELNDNAPAHNFYLSLIVNNYMDFIAKVAFIGEAKKDIKQVPYTAKNVDGHDYIIEKQDFEVNTRKLFIYDCEIDAPKTTILVTDQFSAQVAKIMEPKPVKTPASNVQSRFPAPADKLKQGQGWQRGQQKSRQFKTQEEREMESWNKSFKTPKKEKNLFDDWDVPWNVPGNLIDDLEEQDLEEKAIYDFCKSLFHFTNGPIDDFETLEDVLEVVADFNLSPSELAKAVINDYAKTFNQHFPNANSRGFIEKTYEAIDVLNDLKILYPEIGLSIKTIEAMIFKFMENEAEKHNPTV